MNVFHRLSFIVYRSSRELPEEPPKAGAEGTERSEPRRGATADVGGGHAQILILKMYKSLFSRSLPACR